MGFGPLIGLRCAFLLGLSNRSAAPLAGMQLGQAIPHGSRGAQDEICDRGFRETRSFGLEQIALFVAQTSFE